MYAITSLRKNVAEVKILKFPMSTRPNSVEQDLTVAASLRRQADEASAASKEAPDLVERIRLDQLCQRLHSEARQLEQAHCRPKLAA